MHPDKRVGLSLGILLIGVTAAFFFRNDVPVDQVQALELTDPESLDQQIRRKAQTPYLPDRPEATAQSETTVVRDALVADVMPQPPILTDPLPGTAIPEPICPVGESPAGRIAPIPHPSVDPDEIDQVPANVTGQIVPKTLFGEKYVSLVIPDAPASDSLQPGDVIDQTKTATEVEAVLNDLYPLLRTVQPAELNMTLNALATALEGRGDQLGDNLETIDRYLKRFNPQLPALVEDLRLTARVSDIYADVLPEVGQILRDQITTLGTLENREDALNALFNDVSDFSGSAEDFLRTNGDNLIRLGEVSKPQVTMLAKYAPEFSCLSKGIVNAGKLQAEAFRNFTLHIVLETLPNQPRGYNVNDVPRYGEDRGPNCLNLPNPPWNQDNPVRAQPNMDDGVDEPTRKHGAKALERLAQLVGVVVAAADMAGLALFD